MSEEKVFFENGDVKVTSARFVTFGKTQALSGITAVSSHYVSPKRTGPIVLAVVGLLCLFAEQYILALVLIALAVVWWIMQKTVYFVRLESASGTSDAFSSKDQDLIFKIVDALNEAIIHRG
jgi:ABC-type uncharacterized transport system permease subunit